MNLTEIVKNSGLEVVESKSVIDRFGSYESLAKEWETKAKAIVVTSSEQTIEIAMAREARKKFTNLRIDVEKARKSMKEQSLRKGQAIDAIARFLTSLILPIEEHLRNQEDFVKIQEEKKAEQERIELEKKIEEERLAKEKAEREEQERIRLENEKLKKEAVERERVLAEERLKAEKEKKVLEEKARLEREKAEAEKLQIQKEQQKKLDDERKERERVEFELKEKKDAEELKKKQELEAERLRIAEINKAKNDELKRSDGDKYVRYIKTLLDIQQPIVQDATFNEKLQKINTFFLREIES